MTRKTHGNPHCLSLGTINAERVRSKVRRLHCLRMVSSCFIGFSSDRGRPMMIPVAEGFPGLRRWRGDRPTRGHVGTSRTRSGLMLMPGVLLRLGRGQWCCIVLRYRISRQGFYADELPTVRQLARMNPFTVDPAINRSGCHADDLVNGVDSYPFNFFVARRAPETASHNGLPRGDTFTPPVPDGCLLPATLEHPRVYSHQDVSGFRGACQGHLRRSEAGRRWPASRGSEGPRGRPPSAGGKSRHVNVAIQRCGSSIPTGKDETETPYQRGCSRTNSL